MSMRAARCPSAHQGLTYYQLRHSSWFALRGIKVEHDFVYPRSCAYTKLLVQRWKVKAYKARQAYYRWRESQWVLHETPSWLNAVEQVQRVFPGTESWLISCADAEGWNRSSDTRWVIYGSRTYYPGAEYSYNGSLPQVGGPMQYMWGTFKGHYRHGLEHVLSKGYEVPPALRNPENVYAWRSMLAQAIAAGWARFTGNDNSHWSASWGNGC